MNKNNKKKEWNKEATMIRKERKRVSEGGIEDSKSRWRVNDVCYESRNSAVQSRPSALSAIQRRSVPVSAIQFRSFLPRAIQCQEERQEEKEGRKGGAGKGEHKEEEGGEEWR